MKRCNEMDNSKSCWKGSARVVVDGSARSGVIKYGVQRLGRSPPPQ
jgi:hypothetical protein